jgi:hypothetical protein
LLELLIHSGKHLKSAIGPAPEGPGKSRDFIAPGLRFVVLSSSEKGYVMLVQKTISSHYDCAVFRWHAKVGGGRMICFEIKKKLICDSRECVELAHVL